MLAMLRGETEGLLRLRVEPAAERAVGDPQRLLRRERHARGAEQVALAVEDGYRRLLAPSIETEVRLELKKRADDEAIRVFAENLRELLLASPLGQKRVMALDPGFRTGCKLVCLDAREAPAPRHHLSRTPASASRGGRHIVARWWRSSGSRPSPIGNGTAGRETEAFVRDLGPAAVGHRGPVNEAGASVYSASEAAREEFPDQDVTVRGAVSIGRRLMDPLAELVKIDPKIDRRGPVPARRGPERARRASTTW